MKSKASSLLIATVSVLYLATHAFAKPLNVLVLFADDWRHDTLGVAGSQAMKEFKTPWAETYPGLLGSHGYFTGHIGKWHNGRFPAEHFDFGRSYQVSHWHKEPDGSKIHVTRKNERDAMEFLRTRPSDKPFCLTLAFSAPHAEDHNPKQYLPQPESMALYQNVTIPIPKTANDEALRKIPPFARDEQTHSRVRWHWRYETPEKYQQMMYWPDAKLEQLFHVAEDPFEENDHAENPAHAQRLAEMRARFAELKTAAK